MKMDNPNMRYRRQATDIVNYFNSVADKVANSSRHFKVQFRKPNIMNYNLLSIFFDEREKVFFARYGAGENIWFQFQDNFKYDDITRKYTVFDRYSGGDSMMPDIMNNWNEIKSMIQLCINEQKSFDSFQV